jgi:acyl carrier protein
MGLDIVELVMAVEVAFGVDIPDAHAERLRTPRDVATYLRARLPTAPGGASCLTQQAFYRTRRAVVSRFGRRRDALRPATALTSVIPADGRSEHWRALRSDLRVEAWPRLSAPGWQNCVLGGARTLGDLAGHLATWSPGAVKAGAGWTETEIERAVLTLVEAETGVDMTKHTIDSRFVDDMGLD